MIPYAINQEVPYEVSVFLRIKPQIFAVLEMMVSLVMIVFVIISVTISADYFLLASPVFYIITGSVIILAACKCKVCLVKTAQAFTYLNMVVFAIFFRFHLIFALTWGVSGIVLMVCDVLVLIFSIVIAAAFCSCCCRPESRSVAVSYVVPANSVRLLNHSDPSASLQPVVYVLPAAYAQVPLSPPPNYDTVIAAPSGNYSLIPTAPPAKYSSIPTAPPPAYDQASVFFPPEFGTQGQEDTVHQHIK